MIASSGGVSGKTSIALANYISAIGYGSDDERFDGDFMLMTGELSKLMADVVEALGGEMREFGSVTSATTPTAGGTVTTGSAHTVATVATADESAPF